MAGKAISPCIEARDELREVCTSPSVAFNSVNSDVTCTRRMISFSIVQNMRPFPPFLSLLRRREPRQNCERVSEVLPDAHYRSLSQVHLEDLLSANCTVVTVDGNM